MSDIKFTPGPWHAEELSGVGIDKGYNVTKAINEKGDKYGVCFVRHLGGGDAGESLANAKLIAAAPELLEAVKNLLIMLPDSMCRDQYAMEARGVVEKTEGGGGK